MNQYRKILSIVIPTYNMERYLEYCLDSLLIKDNFERIEVLVINDGSKDCSLSIAYQYADKYPTVFRVIDKENGNYGSCVNRGLLEATGKYIKILDADDSFETTHFEKFIAYLLEIDADLVLSDFAIVNEERDIVECCRYQIEENREFLMYDICTTPLFKKMEMHAVTYRKDILLDLNYHQTEGISYTDQQWIFIPMLKVQRVYAFNSFVYKYLVGREGQSISSNVRLKSMSHMMQCVYGMIDEYNKYDFEMSEIIREYFHIRLKPIIKDIYITIFAHYSNEGQKSLQTFDLEIKKKNLDIYKLIEETNIGFNYIGFWRKHSNISTFLLNIFTKLYAFLG